MVVENVTPSVPRAYLVERTRGTQAREWNHAIPRRGIWKVTGEAGSGVSSFLVDTVVDVIEHGADARGILLLTSSKQSAARLRIELSDRVARPDFIIDEPLVRSVHSLAFALLRQRTNQDIRLISGAEQDAVIRQLLQGHHEDGRGTWPTDLRPALPMVGFARQLRDFLLRAVERQLSPDDLTALGTRHRVPIWSAAGDFLREYSHVMALNPAQSFSASELISSALRGEIPDQWHTIIVDDTQLLDPSAGELVRRLLERATLGVVGGDVEQSVYRFRGASPNFSTTLGGLDYNTIDLGASRRTPDRRVAVCTSSAAQYGLMASELRRAHLENGIDYRDMAVIVRASSSIEPVRRALLQSGVPVMIDPTDVVLSEQRIVAGLLLGLQALYTQLTPAQWRELLLGPVGGTDPVTLRRLLRGLRRWKPDTRAEETLRELLASPEPLPDFGTMLTERELDILTHVRGVLDAGREQLDNGSVEDVLWGIWNATGLSTRLLAAALRGGASGSQADRDLDSVMALFDAAGDFTERRADAGIEGFVTYIAEQELPTGVRDRRNATPDAVTVLTAHGAVGLEFHTVIVSGLQENEWPALSETGSIFSQEQLVDLIDDGIDPAVPVSRKVARLAEEKRLFHVATSRATHSLLVTAVDDPEAVDPQIPSLFVDDFCSTYDVSPERMTVSDVPISTSYEDETVVRVLAHDDVIAELRRAVRDPGIGEIGRRQAARQLARLAAAGVHGADPAQWWSTTEVSVAESLVLPTHLFPSRIEAALACPMKEVLQKMTGLDSSLNMVWGTIAHAYFEALGRGIDDSVARPAAVAARRDTDDSPRWKSEREIQDFDEMLQRINEWLQKTRDVFEQVAVEAEINVDIAPEVAIVGRADRIERESSGALHIVDLKTGSRAPSVKDTQENPQLEAYQLALSRGVSTARAIRTATAGETPEPVGGALLLYPKHVLKSGAKTAEQAPKSTEQLDDFTELLVSLPRQLAGPELLAVTGDQCTHCKVRALCPVQPEGTVLTHG